MTDELEAVKTELQEIGQPSLSKYQIIKQWIGDQQRTVVLARPHPLAVRRVFGTSAVQLAKKVGKSGKKRPSKPKPKGRDALVERQEKGRYRHHREVVARTEERKC